MWGAVGVVAIAAAIIIIEVPGLWRKGYYKELLAFAVLLISGTALGVALGLHVQVPTPLDWIARLYKSLP